jgi:hypothetical protein
MTVEPTGQPERGQFKPLTAEYADKFVIWCKGRDFGQDREIANKDVLDVFDGFSIDDVRWLAEAIIQAKVIPDLGTMARAILARDVAILRSDDRNP